MSLRIKSAIGEFAQIRKNPIFYCKKLYHHLCDKPCIAHHGIQRSGTNYLSELIKQFGIFVINSVNPSRSHPGHKHFRWQHDKNTIFIDHKYKNNVLIECINEINRVSGFPHNTFHIVVFKEPHIWFKSIINWGIMCNWFGVQEGIQNANNILQEWDHYYAFWQDMNVHHPDKVIILNYDHLCQNPYLLVETLRQAGFLIPENLPHNLGSFKELPMSPTTRKNYLSDDEIDCLRRVAFEFEYKFIFK